jgi:hypothetical protein
VPDTQRFVIRPLTIVLIVVGVLLLVVALIYLTVPAGSLPGFVPGNEAGSDHHHTTHALVAAGLGLLALVGAWFSTAPAREQ